jgi:hypothetical protein
LLGSDDPNQGKKGEQMKLKSDYGSRPGIATAWCLLIGLLIVVAGCQTQAPSIKPSAKQMGISRLVVMPFQNMTQIYGLNVNVRCPLCGSVFTTEETQENAESILTRHLVSYLSQSNTFDLVLPDQALNAQSEIMSSSANDLNEKELLIEIGRAFDADSIMVGSLYRFEDRIGGDYGVESPASVSFDLDVIQVSSGRNIWSRRFNETQTSLFENLYKLRSFIRNKGKWITADDLAKYGLEEVLEGFYI